MRGSSRNRTGMSRRICLFIEYRAPHSAQSSELNLTTSCSLEESFTVYCISVIIFLFSLLQIFLRRIGLLLYSRSDPFPLTVPRWRWGIRILQGKGSLPLGNNPRPGGSIKILSWAPIGSSSLKTTSEVGKLSLNMS